MKLLITGSPGTGKTAIAKKLGRSLKCTVINEKDFALEKGLGKWGHDSNELEIPLGKIAKELNKKMEKEKSVILEGHVLCECKLKVDAVIVLRVHPEILEARLEARGYKAEKIQDNVFCEGIDYCKKKALKSYGKKKLAEVSNEKGIKETLNTIVLELKNRGLIE